MSAKNRQIVLAARPEGLSKKSAFRLAESAVPQLAEGQVMVGGTVGTIVESRHPEYRAGEVVVGYWGWQEYAVSDGQGVERFDTSLAPMSTALGVLGMTGMTAYFGLLEIGNRPPPPCPAPTGRPGSRGHSVAPARRPRWPAGGCKCR